MRAGFVGLQAGEVVRLLGAYTQTPGRILNPKP